MASSIYKVRPEDVGSIAVLAADTAFAELTEKEARYAKSLASACWAGSKACSIQLSVESTPAVALVRLWLGSRPYSACVAAAIESGISESDVTGFSAWAVCLVDNLGNYKSFGDTKFIPSIPAETLEAILKTSPNWGPSMEPLWRWSSGLLYDLRPRMLQLGMPDKGISTYYSANVTEEDVGIVQKLLDKHSAPQPYNTRLFKRPDGELELRLASAEIGPSSSAAPSLLLGVHEVEGRKVEVVRGDYAPIMARVVANLAEARENAANEHQIGALNGYIQSFETGSQAAHIAGSEAWVRDKGPAVESYLGFIESYRDPAGVRGEWEGFAACVNKRQSAQFSSLVAAAEPLLARLPWGTAYEKDTFLRPDFTSLDVLAFGSSGIPAGINIPNYDSTRQSVGFKNVSLGNVLSARNSKDRVTFLKDADQDVFSSTVSHAFGIQVGLHELLGHGSGKTFTESADGTLNFDPLVTNPLTGKAVDTWYKPGQTWDSVFGGQASTIEECRAEAVGIYLCVLPEVQAIFGAAHGHEDAEGGGTAGPKGAEADVSYVNWLNMARAGLLALQFYSPATRAWGQAHMQARYALFRVMLDAGIARLHGAEGITAQDVTEGKVGEGESGVHVTVDRSLIESVGLPAVAAFLTRLQVYKSTANATIGLPWYAGITAVPDEWLALRDLVVAKRKPRQMFVQPVLESAEENAARGPATPDARVVVGTTQNRIVLVQYPATMAGVLDAFARRFPEHDPEVLALWEAERNLHVL